jgi:hypothetical protein
MDSKLAKEAETALIATTQGLAPEQRLEAFVAHCRLMAELHAAGTRQREQALTASMNSSAHSAAQASQRSCGTGKMEIRLLPSSP